jgi:hypothetical protein
MFSSNGKCWCSNNCLHFLKRAVPLFQCMQTATTDIYIDYQIANQTALMTILFNSRPKKTVPTLQTNRIIRDDDPCLDSIATESILPLIPERISNPAGAASASQSSGNAGLKGSQGTQVCLDFGVGILGVPGEPVSCFPLLCLTLFLSLSLHPLFLPVCLPLTLSFCLTVCLSVCLSPSHTHTHTSTHTDLKFSQSI